MAKNKVQIKIYGATYSILTDDDSEYVEGLGEFIDEEMRNIAAANPSLSSIQCAVLVALDQADACKSQLPLRIISVRRLRIIWRTVPVPAWKWMLPAEKSKG